MKTIASASVLALLLAACSSPADGTNSPEAATAQTAPSESNAPPTAATPAASMPAPEAPATPATTASASGTVEAIDVAAKTITIAHGPIDALKWPAMTMTFKAPEADLTGFKKGDRVDFELTSTGMDGAVTKITRK